MNIKTRWFKNSAVASMRGMVAKLIAYDCIEWRHHGIGVLQGYIREGTGIEARIHIWNRLLLKPGMDISGDIHDHRFNMVSHVLHGEVDHVEIAAVPDDRGSFCMMALTHARAASDTNYGGPTTPIDGRYIAFPHRMTIGEGSSYYFPMQTFHKSPLTAGNDDVAISVIEKHLQQDTPARILYPADVPPVMAFGHDIDPNITGYVIELAKRALN